jgi:hypothetical protein
MYPVNLSEKKKTEQNGKKENIQGEGSKRACTGCAIGRK